MVDDDGSSIMKPLDDTSDLLDYSNFIDYVPTSTDLCWANDQISGFEGDASFIGLTPQEQGTNKDYCPRKRARGDSSSKVGTKACRERLRREKLNERFLELSSLLEPGRPPKTDKLAILGDAIRVLSQMKEESEEYKETNQKLQEEIKTLKLEKNELRQEKQILKENKEMMEHQLKSVSTASAGFMQSHPVPYHTGVNKMPVYPSYGFVPMWHYLPPSTVDVSQDQHLRPPAA